MKMETLFVIIRSYIFISIACMSVNQSGNIVIIDFTKQSINCHLQGNLIILVKSLIQCAKLCAFDNKCDGLQYHVPMEISDWSRCPNDTRCDGDGYYTGECLLLQQEQMMTAVVYKNNTVIISKTRDLNQKDVKQCFALLADGSTTIQSIRHPDCQFTAAIFMNDTKEIMIFTPTMVFIYNSTIELGTGLYKRRLIAELFEDLSGTIQSGYSNGRLVYLIVQSNVFTYNSTTRARYIKKETVHEHFHTDLPRQIDGLIVTDTVLHVFSKNYIYDASNHPMVIKPFRSRSIYNPYRETYSGIRPRDVIAATGIGDNTFLFLDNTEFYLFTINSLRRGTQAGKWKKGKTRLLCSNK